MLLIDQAGSSDISGQNTAAAIEVQSTALSFANRFLPASQQTARLIVHVIADEPQQRALMARMIFATNHHAEVYADAAELLVHRPASGVVLVHESDNFGAKTVCKEVAASGLWLPVIGFGEAVDAARILAGMKAGALDYLIGPITVDAMQEKLQACASEAEVLNAQFRRQAEAQLLMNRLSERERQVLDLLTEGMSNKNIARSLGISPRTVEIHRMKMMGKIGASSSAQAVRIHVDASRQLGRNVWMLPVH